MTKPVLYLTDDIVTTARALYPQVMSYKIVGRSYAQGIFKSGDDFYVFNAMNPKDLAQDIKGMEFSRFEIVGSAHPDAIEIAKSRIRP